jgi:hypothetical protein
MEHNNRTHTSHIKLWNKTTEHTPSTSNYGTKQPNTHLPRQTMEQNNRTHTSHIKLRNKTTEHTHPTSNYGTNQHNVGGVCSVVLFHSLTWKVCVRLLCSIVWRGRCVFGCFVPLFDVVGVCSVVLFHSLTWGVCVRLFCSIVWRGRCVFGCFVQ